MIVHSSQFLAMARANTQCTMYCMLQAYTKLCASTVYSQGNKDGTAKKACKCGSKNHSMTTHGDCPFHKKNTKQTTTHSPDTTHESMHAYNLIALLYRTATVSYIRFLNNTLSRYHPRFPCKKIRSVVHLILSSSS